MIRLSWMPILALLYAGLAGAGAQRQDWGAFGIWGALAIGWLALGLLEVSEALVDVEREGNKKGYKEAKRVYRSY